MDVKESYIESELYRIFKNIIVQRPTFIDVEFYDIKDRMPVGDGEADIVIFGKRKNQDVKLVIETKKRTRKYVRKLDPYSVSVIGQALGYASVLSSQFIATSNGDILIVFDTFKKGSILQSQVGDVYKVVYSEDFALRVLSNLAKYLNGQLKLLELDQIFVERVRYFHELLAEPTYLSLKNMVEKDPKFSQNYKEWIQKQGFDNNEQTKRNIAEQEAYLIMNRVLFYKTLEAYQSGLDLLPLKSFKESDFTPSILINRMNECFSYVVNNIDYQAVFKSSEILDEIPITDEVAEHLNEFIKDIEQYNLSEFDRDIIGDVYQSLIPADERKRLGQYYTPKEICDLIVNFSINNKDDKVLDPSCGSGGFIVSAYRRLLELNAKEKNDPDVHNKIISQIYGFDINQFATHLSAINLTLRNVKAKSDKMNIFPIDFFKIPSFQASLTQEDERESIQGKVKDYIALNSDFDAIIANPPYTRQDDIGDKEYVERLRSIALTFYEKRKKGKKTKNFEIKVKMSTEAGIYAYFITHSSHFLKEGGIMGYIVYNSWLDVKFGIDLQRFLLDNFKIVSIIDFDKRIFKDASANTVVILMNKLTGKNKSVERDNNIVKFIRVKTLIQTDDLIEMIKNNKDSTENENIRIVTISQRELRLNHKWSSYLKAPSIYYELINNKKMCKLKDVADISVGYVTLANPFFVIPKEQAEILDIENEFLRPAITKAKNLKYLDVTVSDADSYLLFVDKNKDELKGTNVLKYIEEGEQKSIQITRGSKKGQIVQGYQNTPALKEKKGDWYKLKDIGVKEIIIPCLVWNRWYASLNKGVYTNDTFYWLNPKKKSTIVNILGILNSTLSEFFVEIMGKSGYGEGVLELRKHQFEELPILNPEKISQDYENQIDAILQRMIKSSRNNNAAEVDIYRKQLDDLIFDILGVNKVHRKELYGSLETLRNSRKNKIKTELLVS
jgi:type I restriction enzyme M protein